MGTSSDLERYRQVARLGVGGMSTVELAEDTLLGRRVALKRMHTPDDLAAHSRLRREALIGASLTHPNLVSIFDIHTTDEGDDVIVMEYVEGETLAQRLTERGRLDLPTTLRILSGVSSALDAIHAERIVHRDVKPGNILLGDDGSVKLADLGIAAVPDRTRITSDGAVLGTFSYMAPEQLEGAPALPAVDVYALAAVAYEMLSGERARNEPNPVALAHAISTQPPPDLRTAWPEAPPEAAELLIRAMSRDPDARPSSAGDLTARLRAALEPQATAPLAPPEPPAEAERDDRRDGVAPAAGAAAAGAAAAGAAAAGAAAADAAAADAASADAGPAPAAAPAPSTARTSEQPARAPDRAASMPARGSVAPPGSRTPPPARVMASGSARRGRSRGPGLALAALALTAVAAAVIVLASSGGAKHPSQTSASKPARHTATHSSQAATSSSSSSAGAATTPAGGASTAASGSPVSAVENFYHLAAAHQYSSAWALADPSFRNQLAGYSSFESGQAGDRSITFNSANVTSQSGNSATVYIRTTSVRDNGTQHCFGPVSLIRGSSGWLLDHISINCN